MGYLRLKLSCTSNTNQPKTEARPNLKLHQHEENDYFSFFPNSIHKYKLIAINTTISTMNSINQLKILLTYRHT